MNTVRRSHLADAARHSRLASAARHRRLRAQLGSYVDGELDATSVARVREHLTRCAWCSGDVRTYLLIRAALRRRARTPSLPVARLRRFAWHVARA